MKKVNFLVGGSIMRASDAAIILEGEDPLEALIDAAIQTISTDFEITVGDVTMHLAGWKNPDHWSEDWQEKGIEPDGVYELVANAVVEE